MIEALLIAGTFDYEGGKPSGVMRKFTAGLKHQSITVINGGTLATLHELDPSGYEVIYWFPNVDNSEEKFLPRIKAQAPHATLVMSKFNPKGVYDQHYLEQRMLSARSNLLLEITGGERFSFRILDSLGNMWLGPTANITDVADVMCKVVGHLRAAKRVPSNHAGSYILPRDTTDLTQFFQLLRKNADRFHELIHGANPERFLGNASFRAGGLIYVSRRNIDKRDIGLEGFVPINLNDSLSERGAWYYGPNKPSVDTPIQIALYEHYPHINYMIHSHTYIKGAPFTNIAYPCGDMREAGGVIEEVGDSLIKRFTINLIGHGSLAAANSLDFFLEILEYTPRTTPEYLSYQDLG